ncbi:MAG: hypothetical protein JHC91_04915 [Chloroflexi bacterium]|nr:hypothetical protein [Chloroflexota bacterium]
MTRGSRPGGGEGAERTALLAAARAGSQDAFRDLFTPDLDLAWRMALRITGSEASADDALQAGLLSAYRSLDRVAPTNLRGWFVRIVENAARDLMRRERRHPTLPFASETHEEAGEGAHRERVAAEPQAGRPLIRRSVLRRASSPLPWRPPSERSQRSDAGRSSSTTWMAMTMQRSLS